MKPKRARDIRVDTLINIKNARLTREVNPNQARKVSKASNYVGVYVSPKAIERGSYDQYRAIVGSSYHKVYTKYFWSELEAALAYDVIRYYLDGDRAKINFPEKMPEYKTWLSGVTSLDEAKAVVRARIVKPHLRRNATQAAREKFAAEHGTEVAQ